MGVPFSVNAYVNTIDQQYTIHLQENDERDYDNVSCYINLYVDRLNDKRLLFKNSDTYIMNRSMDNVRYVEMAQDYGVSIVSGVDIPIFDKEITQQTMIRK